MGSFLGNSASYPRPKIEKGIGHQADHLGAPPPEVFAGSNRSIKGVVMTAVEFLGKKEKFQGRILFFAFAVPVTILLAGMIGEFIYGTLHHINNPGSWFVFWVGIPTATTYALGFWAQNRARDKFIHAHPEMENLDEWVSLMGSAERYPTDDAAKIALLPEAFVLLERYAKSTNMAFNLRNLNRELRDRYPKNSFQWASLDIFCDGLAKRADEIYIKDYRRRWYLLVTHLKLKVNPDNLEAFREQFIKDDPLSSVKIA